MHDFYRTIPQAKSLYLRGSASKIELKYQPWDIDFIIVLPKNTNQKERIRDFVNEKNKIFVDRPLLDLRLVHDEDVLNIKYIHTLLLICDNSRLISGDALNLSHIKTISEDQRREVFNLYICNFETRLHEYIKNQFTRSVRVEKSKRLIKSLLRIGGLQNFLKGGSFSRDPLHGLNMLLESKDFNYDDYILASKYMNGILIEDLDLINKIFKFYLPE